MKKHSELSRRDLLKLGLAAAALPLVPRMSLARADSDGDVDYTLTAAESPVQLSDEPFPETMIWGFNAVSPGPEIRVKQGHKVRILVRNELPQSLTVHWHGLRIDNAMDGVPHLTQPPIKPGDSFLYEFTPPDAGTFWYHSHVNTAEQVGRGLYGALIVDEAQPPAVDRDITWMLDDWRLDDKAQIIGDFNNPRDLARAGRLGNTITLNGSIPRDLEVRAGERIRLRLINAANARVFSLRFQHHSPQVITRDGQPVEPYSPGGPIVIGPAQRLDLIVDMLNEPGESFSVIDTLYPQSPFRLTDIVYSAQAAIERPPLKAVARLPANPIPEPDLNDSALYPVVLTGGDLGTLKKARMGNRDLDITRLYLLGKMWAINGVVSNGATKTDPMFEVERGRTVTLEFQNATAWPHPMHLHGHHFKVLEHSRDKEVIGAILDTVLLGPGEQAKVAFVADNPGSWLFHCHILGHARSGMLTLIKVT
jgi:FtsP/CotA-like multicopper oxidase with cupredoxin domain